jgi:hypothetical protein
VGLLQVLRVEFMQRLVQEHVTVASQVLIHLCFMNMELSNSILTFLRNSVVSCTQHTVSLEMKPFFIALTVPF